MGALRDNFRCRVTCVAHFNITVDPDIIIIGLTTYSGVVLEVGFLTACEVFCLIHLLPYCAGLAQTS